MDNAPEPDHFEGNIGANIAGGYVPKQRTDCGSSCYPTGTPAGPYRCGLERGHDGYHHSAYGERAWWDGKQVWIGKPPPEQGAEPCGCGHDAHDDIGCLADDCACSRPDQRTDGTADALTEAREAFLDGAGGERLARALATFDALTDRETKLTEALVRIRDCEPDQSSTDQTAFFWSWAKEVAATALPSVPAEPESDALCRCAPDEYCAAGDCRGAVPDEADALAAKVKRLTEALRLIAAMPTSERNPDGEEQAAHSMRLVAESALRASTEEAL